jgi:all-trans-retinol 13,14-reductase
VLRSRSLKQVTLADRYDVVVIGSGLGGMVTARLLAETGKNVLVLERHYTLGGFTHVFRRKGWEWDVGVHYVGRVHEPQHIMRRLLDRVSDGELNWEWMGEVYDRIIFPDATYEFRSGVSEFKDGLKQHFTRSRDAKAIDAYVEAVFDAVKTSKWFHMEKALRGMKAVALGPFFRRGFLHHSRKTTWEVLRGITDNERLVGVLTGQYGDYGLPPRQSSFAMHAAVVHHYFKGGSYPVGGSARFAETIVAGIERAGGTCVVRAPVRKITLEGGRVTGVELETGQRIAADLVVSNAGAINTFEHLLPDAGEAPWRGALTRLEPSVAHASLYLGFDGSPDDLNLPRANDWIYPGYDHDTSVHRFLADPDAALPLVYLSFPAAKDPDFPRRFPGKSTVEAITLAPWERFRRWKDTRWKHRGEDYEREKKALTDRLLAALFEQHPQLKPALAYHELSTPLSTRHFTGYEHGEIYGLSHDPDRFESKLLRPKTPIEGLYLTGQDVVTCGIGGALMSGFLTASVITDRNLLQPPTA